MSQDRYIDRIYQAKPTLEGAGVRLQRVFGHGHVSHFDPFLMLDDFGSSDPRDYVAGFPWHPHRGIETVTYMLHGTVRHADSLKNEGTIGSGDLQWMTAGRGIIHQEMPQKQNDFLRGLQLWVNLPAKNKMMKPRYRDIAASDVPELKSADGVVVKVLAGRYRNHAGPVRDIICDPQYLDISMPPAGRFSHEIDRGHRAFAYILNGDGSLDGRGTVLSAGQCGLYSDGLRVDSVAGTKGVRFVLVSGKPIHEPVAWRGPIVMNTEEELDQAFREYANGTFLTP